MRFTHALAWLVLGLLDVAQGAPLPVVATFSVLGDLVQQVGGPQVAVTTLVGPNGDAHIYQPSAQDAKAIAQARLVVMNGLGFEGWMDRLARSSGYHGILVTASEGVPPRKMSDGRADPHAWQDPDRARRYIANIEHGLATADPANAAAYHQRAQAYLVKLDALAHWADAQIAAIPPAQRRAITSHDAFGYLGERFGIRFQAAQGIGTESEASAKDLGVLIQQIRRDKIHAVFIENVSNPRLMQQVAQETGVKLGAELYSDALSKADGPAADYLSMMQHNLSALVVGLKQN